MAQRRVNRRAAVDTDADDRVPPGRGEQEILDEDDPGVEDEHEVLGTDDPDADAKQDVLDEDEAAAFDQEDELEASGDDEPPEADGRKTGSRRPGRRSARPASRDQRPARRDEGPARRASRPARGDNRGYDSALTVREAARTALREIAGLTSKQVEGITGVERTDDGWLINIEVVEDRRIPSSTDVLATYETALSSDGELVSYQRLRRYTRGRGGNGEES